MAGIQLSGRACPRVWVHPNYHETSKSFFRLVWQPQSYNPSIQEAEAGRQRDRDQLELRDEFKARLSYLESFCFKKTKQQKFPKRQRNVIISPVCFDQLATSCQQTSGIQMGALLCCIFISCAHCLRWLSLLPEGAFRTTQSRRCFQIAWTQILAPCIAVAQI